ncbi:uncharacterized protein [Spinacia oleracea]|uniref:DUF8039 domain-containing protein n=2 Tax=Spinacia oleracea TaxID=3562 RepID=A0ABM3RNP7_SPIOL|nr:uncharacterized protein LOC110778190 [Spinacia oleracea]
MDEDQHANSGPSNKSPNQVPQKQKKKPRGPTKGIKSMPGVPRIIEWDHLDRPTGKWATDYKNHIGEISRAKVSILIRTWEDVSQGIKDTLWEDVKREFHITDETKKEVVLKSCDKRWREFKSRLTTGWIRGTRKRPKDEKMPYDLYSYITKDIWKEFVKIRTSEEAEEISEKARQSQSFNIYPHHMGQKSYAEMTSEWQRKGYIPSVSSSSEGSSASTISSSLPSRTCLWLLARSVPDEKGNPYLPDEGTQKVKENIDEWKRKQDEGEFVPKSARDDVLSRALGKTKEGRPLTFGGGVGIKAVWGTGERRSFRRYGDAEMEEMEARVTKRVKDETIQEMNSKMDAMVMEKFITFAKELGVQIPSHMRIDANVHSSCRSGGLDPFADITEPVPCHLYLNIGSEKVFVAYGTICPELLLDHHNDVTSDNVKVSVDDFEPAYKEAPVPVPSQYIKKLAQAHGTFTQWPKHLVSLTNEEVNKPTSKEPKGKGNKGKEIVVGGSGTKASNTKSKTYFLENYKVQNLSGKCNVMKTMMLGLKEGEHVKVHCTKRTFNMEKDLKLVSPLKTPINFSREHGSIYQ